MPPRMGSWVLEFVIVFSLIHFEYANNEWHNNLSKRRNMKSTYSFKHFLKTRVRRESSAEDNLDSQLAIEERMKGTVSAKDNLDNQLAMKEIMKGTDASSGNPCLAVPCVNGGTCTWKKDSELMFTCKCVLGYTGRLCDQSLPECETQPCYEKGSCVATPKGFVCICQDGFDGVYCEERKKRNGTVIVISNEELEEGEEVIGVFVAVILITFIVLVIHVVRVNKRREVMKAQYHILLVQNEELPPLPPGICEVSNLMCFEFFCCCCPKWSESLKKYKKAVTKLELQKAYEETMNANTSPLIDEEEEPLLYRSSASSIQPIDSRSMSHSYEETMTANTTPPTDEEEELLFASSIHPIDKGSAIHLHKPSSSYSFDSVDRGNLKDLISKGRTRSLTLPKTFSSPRPQRFASVPVTVNNSNRGNSSLQKKPHLPWIQEIRDRQYYSPVPRRTLTEPLRTVRSKHSKLLPETDLSMVSDESIGETIQNAINLRSQESLSSKQSSRIDGQYYSPVPQRTVTEPLRTVRSKHSKLLPETDLLMVSEESIGETIKNAINLRSQESLSSKQSSRIDGQYYSPVPQRTLTEPLRTVRSKHSKLLPETDLLMVSEESIGETIKNVTNLRSQESLSSKQSSRIDGQYYSPVPQRTLTEPLRTVRSKHSKLLPETDLLMVSEESIGETIKNATNLRSQESLSSKQSSHIDGQYYSPVPQRTLTEPLLTVRSKHSKLLPETDLLMFSEESIGETIKNAINLRSQESLSSKQSSRIDGQYYSPVPQRTLTEPLRTVRSKHSKLLPETDLLMVSEESIGETIKNATNLRSQESLSSKQSSRIDGQYYSPVPQRTLTEPLRTVRSKHSKLLPETDLLMVSGESIGETIKNATNLRSQESLSSKQSSRIDGQYYSPVPQRTLTEPLRTVRSKHSKLLPETDILMVSEESIGETIKNAINLPSQESLSSKQSSRIDGQYYSPVPQRTSTEPLRTVRSKHSKLLPETDLLMVSEESIGETIKNVINLPSQESLSSKQSSRILPNVPSASTSLKYISPSRRASIQRWSYSIEPHALVTRRKSLNYDSQSISSDVEYQSDPRRTLQSKQSSLSRNSSYKSPGKHVSKGRLKDSPSQQSSLSRHSSSKSPGKHVSKGRLKDSPSQQSSLSRHSSYKSPGKHVSKGRLKDSPSQQSSLSRHSSYKSPGKHVNKERLKDSPSQQSSLSSHSSYKSPEKHVSKGHLKDSPSHKMPSDYLFHLPDQVSAELTERLSQRKQATSYHSVSSSSRSSRNIPKHHLQQEPLRTVQSKHSKLPPEADLLMVSEESIGETLNNVINPRSQESLSSKQSSGILPNVPSASPSLKNMSASRRASIQRWSYSIEPHVLVSRSKSLNYDSQSISSDVEYESDPRRSLQSKQSSLSRNSSYKSPEMHISKGRLKDSPSQQSSLSRHSSYKSPGKHVNKGRLKASPSQQSSLSSHSSYKSPEKHVSKGRLKDSPSHKMPSDYLFYLPDQVSAELTERLSQRKQATSNHSVSSSSRSSRNIPKHHLQQERQFSVKELIPPPPPPPIPFRPSTPPEQLGLAAMLKRRLES